MVDENRTGGLDQDRIEAVAIKILNILTRVVGYFGAFHETELFLALLADLELEVGISNTYQSPHHPSGEGCFRWALIGHVVRTVTLR